MKKILFILPVAIMAIFILQGWKTAPAEEAAGIQFFEGSLKDAQAKAQKEKKLIFLDMKTDWCFWCKKLKKESFPDKATGEYYNKHFVSMSLDAQKGEGLELARKHRVAAYPTLLFTDADGKLLLFAEGFMPSEKLVEMAKDVVAKGAK